MGGLLIILSVFVSTILWADLKNIYIWILILTIFIFGTIGFADDYKKITSNSSNGISSKIRILLQIIFLLITYLILLNLDPNIIIL